MKIKLNNKFLKFLIIIIIFLIFGIYLKNTLNSFPYQYPKNEIEINLQKNSGGLSQPTIYLIKAGEIVGRAKITKVPNSDSGLTLVNWNIINFKSTFRNSAAPYGGQVTSQISCESQKFIKEQSVIFLKKESKVLLGVANNRQIFGSCVLDEIKYATGVWAGYDDSNKQVLSIELFKAIQSPIEIENAQNKIFVILNKIISP